MDKELHCDFYFGDKVGSEIKKLDYTKLKGFKKEIKNTVLFGTTFKWQNRVWQLIFKKYKYYIITGDSSYLSNWVLLVLGKMFGKTVIPWSHGIKGDDTNRMQWFEEWFFKLCPLILLYGNHSRDVMIDKGFDSKKLICIYNSLDYSKQKVVRKNLNPSNIYSSFFKNNHPTILYIGRLQKNKKLELLVECSKILNDAGSYCNLIFVGKDLGDNEVLKTAMAYNMIDKIWFYGPCYKEDKIGELIYNAHVCVSPGPVGLTALHSLTYGTPVISNDAFTSQMPEHEVIIPKKTGDFFESDNLNDLAEKISLWINIDAKRRKEVRADCHKVINNNWNPESQINTLKKIFLNAKN